MKRGLSVVAQMTVLYLALSDGATTDNASTSPDPIYVSTKFAEDRRVNGFARQLSLVYIESNTHPRSRPHPVVDHVHSLSCTQLQPYSTFFKPWGLPTSTTPRRR
jgi:hypothetical protein